MITACSWRGIPNYCIKKVERGVGLIKTVACSVKLEILQISIFQLWVSGIYFLVLSVSPGHLVRRSGERFVRKLRYSDSDFHIFVITLGQESTDFSKPFQNSSRLKSDKKNFPYWGHNSIRRNRTKSIRQGFVYLCFKPSVLYSRRDMWGESRTQ